MVYAVNGWSRRINVCGGKTTVRRKTRKTGGRPQRRKRKKRKMKVKGSGIYTFGVTAFFGFCRTEWVMTHDYDW
jgi:hypothetical protein